MFRSSAVDLLYVGKGNPFPDTAGECIWLHLDLIKGMMKFCKNLFPVTDYAYTTIPTYPSGQIGFVLCIKNPDTVFNEPVRKWTSQEVGGLSLKYYNADVHKAAFVLPEFARKVIREHAENGDAEETNGTN